MTLDLTPLRFKPQFRRYLWGGRRLGTVLGKPIGEGDDYAESWEVVDHGDDQSIVAAGPLAGWTLRRLHEELPRELYGAHSVGERFPLLLKFLDANRKLSVQVHPDDAMGATLDPPDLGKTEAWYVLAADPGAKLYCGLAPGVGPERLANAVASGTCDEVLHVVEPSAGDCIFIPAGTVHALGDGLVIAEIQQSSDTTFRLFDWNRVGADGKPRQLHVEQGLAATDFERGPVEPVVGEAVGPGRTRLVACDKFLWDRCELAEETSLGGDGRFHIIAVVEGEIDVAGDPVGQPLVRGQSMLLPAGLPPTACTPRHGSATVLDAYLP